MNEIRDLFPGRMRERTFQLKARRDAGAVWHEPQFVECKQCGRRATRTIWTRSLYVCPNCGYHMPIGGYYRLSLVLDHGSFRELDADLPPQDVLRFPGYPEKLTAAQNKTGLREAAVTATGRIEADGNLRLLRLHAINRQPSFPLCNGKNLLRRPWHAHIRRRKQQKPQHAACRPFFCDMYPFPSLHTKFPPRCFF